MKKIIFAIIFLFELLFHANIVAQEYEQSNTIQQKVLNFQSSMSRQIDEYIENQY
jgi:hypothetical protein